MCLQISYIANTLNAAISVLLCLKFCSEHQERTNNMLGIFVRAMTVEH